MGRRRGDSSAAWKSSGQRRGPMERSRVPASPGQRQAGWAARVGNSREPKELMLSSNTSHPTSAPLPIPCVIRDACQPLAPQQKGDARYQWGGSAPKDALSSKLPCAGKPRECHLFRYTKSMLSYIPKPLNTRQAICLPLWWLRVERSPARLNNPAIAI